jgi:hypothetical protein
MQTCTLPKVHRTRADALVIGTRGVAIHAMLVSMEARPRFIIILLVAGFGTPSLVGKSNSS